MKLTFLVVLASLISVHAFAQTDFIVLKKKNNRTLRSYFPGTYLEGETYSGFYVHGYIQQLRNDSIFLQQIEVRQVPTQFGTPVLDTMYHSIILHYTDIRIFDYDKRRARDRGKSVLVPKLLQFGGAGYVILELVNSLNRKESLNEGNKLAGLGIGAATFAAGYAWQRIKTRPRIAGKHYSVEYVRMNAQKK